MVELYCFFCWESEVTLSVPGHWGWQKDVDWKWIRLSVSSIQVEIHLDEKKCLCARHCMNYCPGSRQSKTSSQAMSNQLVTGGVGDTQITQDQTEFAIYQSVLSSVDKSVIQFWCISYPAHSTCHLLQCLSPFLDTSSSRSCLSNLAWHRGDAL